MTCCVQSSGCLVCGEDLLYFPDTVISTACAWCGKPAETGVICRNGHYICDDCHQKDILSSVEQLCNQSDLTDAILLAEEVFKLPGLHMHGPEYHSIVPAVLVAAYGNKKEKGKNALAVREAIRRGQAVAGGMCGSHGACGAALGVGVAYSIIHQVTPLSAESRGAAGRLTALALLEISSYGGPRCCKRETMLALETAVRNWAEFAGGANRRYLCGQSRHNRECLGQKCPYSKKVL